MSVIGSKLAGMVGMRHDDFGLKPPNDSYVDMLERMTHGLHVDVIQGEHRVVRPHWTPSPASTERESNRRSSRSSRDEQD
jgi:hypothetical protein